LTFHLFILIIIRHQHHSQFQYGLNVNIKNGQDTKMTKIVSCLGS
jgi:hypothetical protein